MSDVGGLRLLRLGAVGLASKRVNQHKQLRFSGGNRLLSLDFFFSVPYHLRAVEFINSIGCGRLYYSFFRVNDLHLCCWAVGGELSCRYLSSIVLSVNPACL